MATKTVFVSRDQAHTILSFGISPKDYLEAHGIDPSRPYVMVRTAEGLEFSQEQPDEPKASPTERDREPKCC